MCQSSSGGDHSMRNIQSQSPTPATAANPSTAATSSNPSGKTWGYVRVSTREQNEARQLVALRDFGVTEDSVFMDKLSGKKFSDGKFSLCYGRFLGYEKGENGTMVINKDQAKVVERIPSTAERPSSPGRFAAGAAAGGTAQRSGTATTSTAGWSGSAMPSSRTRPTAGRRT